MAFMSQISGNQPPEQKERKPPKDCWNATEPFCDLKASHWVEIGLTLALVGVGVAQFTVYNRQAGIMNEQTKISDRQLDAMETDKRPWIRATVTISEPIRFENWNGSRGIEASLHFNLKNFGDSPAVNLRIAPEIILHPGNPKRSELDVPQKDTCARASTEADENAIGGIAVFPSESAEIDLGAGLSGIYKTDEPILFSILGCVDYTFAGYRHGQTGFRMLLGHTVKNQIFGLPFVEGSPEPYPEPISPELLAKGYPAKPPNIGLLQSGDFIFRPDDGGNYAK
jgi:hypothetical protein